MITIMSRDATWVPRAGFVMKYAGRPSTPAILKQISCRFVRLKATLDLTCDISLGTDTYKSEKAMSHLLSAH